MSHWSTDSVFYHIYPLGFCGAPEYNDFGQPVQRLEQLHDWIPHLKELGINALYLGPVFQSVKHGYDTADYFQIDCRLGDNDSFAKLCQQLHENGIRVVLDGVFNHVGREFWAFKDVREKGQGSPYCGWFHDLDGLRLDAADCVDFDFFRTLKGFVKDRDPDFWLMGEIIHGDYARWANPEMLDSVTNYECWKGLWSSHNDKNYFEIAHSLNRQFGPGGIYRNLTLYNFADNHDVDRLASKLSDPAHLNNVYTLLYTMPGIPSLYYGSEWAIQGTRTKTSDAALRPHLELKEMEALDQSLCAHLSSLAAIRSAFPALREGQYENVVIKNQQLVFRRSTDSQRVYVVFNLEPQEVHVEFPHQEPVLQDVLNGDQIFNNDGGRTWLPVPPCSARILVGAPDRFAWRP